MQSLALMVCPLMHCFGAWGVGETSILCLVLSLAPISSKLMLVSLLAQFSLWAD
uniref:Uncharacterized protein n=1 Tax=Yersinia enterocolitica TaxID=630 RepID=B0RKU8_YEREN|nr:hypothetical protein [Yersinia enterocolitica]